MPGPDQDTHGIGKLIQEINEEYQSTYNTNDVIFNQGDTDITIGVPNETVDSGGGTGVGSGVQVYHTYFPSNSGLYKPADGTWVIDKDGYEVTADASGSSYSDSETTFREAQAYADHYPSWGTPEKFAAGVETGSNPGDGYGYVGRGWSPYQPTSRGSYGFLFGDMGTYDTNLYAYVHDGNTETSYTSQILSGYGMRTAYSLRAVVEPANGQTRFIVNGGNETVISQVPGGWGDERTFSGFVEAGAGLTYGMTYREFRHEHTA